MHKGDDLHRKEVENMIAIWHEKGCWDKESYTSQRYPDFETLRQATKAFAGVLSCVSIYGDDISEERALRYFFRGL